MSEIQRYEVYADCGLSTHREAIANGDYVLYADHVRVVGKIEQERDQWKHAVSWMLKHAVMRDHPHSPDRCSVCDKIEQASKETP